MLCCNLSRCRLLSIILFAIWVRLFLMYVCVELELERSACQKDQTSIHTDNCKFWIVTSVSEDMFLFCWLLFLINKISWKVVDECLWNFREGVGFVTRKNRSAFDADLHSGVDPEILFPIHLFAVCVKALLYYGSVCVSTTIMTISVMSLISVLHSGLTLQTKTYWWRYMLKRVLTY